MKDRVVTREDWGTLLSMELPVALKRKLAEATVVRAELVPPDVVTLRTRFSYLDETSGDWKVVTLVAERSGSEELSVLSPLGGAVLGAVSGRTVELGQRRVRVGEVLYQPERARYGALPLAP